jgi:hypothetical protein
MLHGLRGLELKIGVVEKLRVASPSESRLTLRFESEIEIRRDSRDQKEKLVAKVEALLPLKRYPDGH